MNSDRESLKENKLEYLYLFDKKEKREIWPIIGSCIRAIGKGWKIWIVSENARREFDKLRDLLLDQNKIELFSVEEIMNEERLPPELVLLDVSDAKVVKKIRDKFLGKTNFMKTDSVDNYEEDYDLISEFKFKELNKEGVISFTGNGKGKTTSAYGFVFQGLLEDKNVCVIQWFKEKTNEKGSWSINEHYFFENMKDPDKIKFFPTGLGFFESPDMDRVKGPGAIEKHRESAKKGLELAKRIISSDECSHLVLDEFIDTVPEISKNISHYLLKSEEVLEVLEMAKKSNVKVAITGRRITPLIQNYIKESCEVKCLRHPFSDRGKKAVSGLDF